MKGEKYKQKHDTWQSNTQALWVLYYMYTNLGLQHRVSTLNL